MPLEGSGMDRMIEGAVYCFEVTIYITVEYSLIYGRVDPTILQGFFVSLKFDSVGILVTVDLIDVDSHSSFIPPSSVFSCG